MHGYFMNSGGRVAAERAKNYIQKNILDHGDVDIFFHCWEQGEESKKLLQDLYTPTKIVYETQKDFKEEIAMTDAEWFDEGYKRSETEYKNNSVFQSFSFAYSRKQSVLLKSEYEKQNDFKYDVVIIARTDLGTRGKDHYNQYYATDIDFDPMKDMSKIYLSYWDQTNWGYTDHWFYSNSENIDLVATFYDKLVDYYKKDSEYTNSVINGWRNSNSEDEHSQEMFKSPEERTKKLVKHEKWHCIDNHKLYKWFFYDVDLEDKLEFVGDKYKSLENLAFIMYSHSEYSDVWPMFFGQTDKYLPDSVQRYVFVDKDVDVPDNWQVVLYDSDQSYSERVAQCLNEVEQEFCIFNHEDMPLYGEPKISLINQWIKLLDSELFTKIMSVDYIKLIRGGEFINYQPILQNVIAKHFFHIPMDQYFRFANQPSIWDIDMLKLIYEETEIEHISEFEEAATETCRQNQIYGVYCYGGEPKRGMYHWDSAVWPYIATAIVKGKWNTTDYPEELGKLLEEYDIDKNIRGTT